MATSMQVGSIESQRGVERKSERNSLKRMCFNDLLRLARGAGQGLFKYGAVLDCRI